LRQFSFLFNKQKQTHTTNQKRRDFLYMEQPRKKMKMIFCNKIRMQKAKKVKIPSNFSSQTVKNDINFLTITHRTN
jgi:hypothetical protein